MSLALLVHDMQLASADYVSLFDLLVSCVDAHGFEPVLDLECFEVQGVRQLRAVSNPHAVRPLALVTQVVGMRATHLDNASVICVQQQSLVLLAVRHGLLAVYVPIKGPVCRINVGIHTQIVLKSRGLVKGNEDAQLKGATQTVGKAAFRAVLGGPIGGVASTEEQGPMPTAEARVIAEVFFDIAPAVPQNLRSPRHLRSRSFAGVFVVGIVVESIESIVILFIEPFAAVA
jgi:hypothetical protein